MLACSSCCKRRSPSEPPVSRSASSPFTRSSTEVRSSSRRAGSLWRSSTSASRYSATVRSLPENSAANRSGSGCPASDSAASRNPAAQPSVRSYNDPSAGSDSAIPAASNRARASVRVKRRSAARISVSSPSSRNRCRPSRRSWRVASTNRSPAGARMSSSSSWRSASAERSSCTSSITSQTRSSSPPRSVSSRSTTAQPSRSGAAVRGRTSFDPAAVSRSAPSTDSQNRCGSRSSPCTGTHAAHAARPLSAIQERTRSVFPLPGGADTSVTRPAAPSSSKSPGRETTPARTAGAAGVSAVPDQVAGLTAPSLTSPVLTLRPLPVANHPAV